MKDDIVVFTGGFDPIHSGHINAINEARELGRVVIGLNSDSWLTRKKGKPFMSFDERKAVLDQFKNVLSVIGFDDSNDSASDAIRQVRKMFPNSKVIFVNGGDRTEKNIPEMYDFKDDAMVEFKFGIGGTNKKNSSSWILKDWKSPETDRLWGSYLNYYETKNVKVKRLIIKPGKSISMQHHTKRAEFWFVESGIGAIFAMVGGNEIPFKEIYQHEHYFVRLNEWHRLQNIGSNDLCVIEIQYGSECSEDDIIRL